MAAGGSQNTNTTQLTDSYNGPQRKKKVGAIYKIIKANHNLHQMTKDTPPVFINNLMKTLGEKIRPSFISAQTSEKIWDNARNWQKKTQS